MVARVSGLGNTGIDPGVFCSHKISVGAAFIVWIVSHIFQDLNTCCQRLKALIWYWHNRSDTAICSAVGHRNFLMAASKLGITMTCHVAFHESSYTQTCY